MGGAGSSAQRADPNLSRGPLRRSDFHGANGAEGEFFLTEQAQGVLREHNANAVKPEHPNAPGA